MCDVTDHGTIFIFTSSLLMKLLSSIEPCTSLCGTHTILGVHLNLIRLRMESRTTHHILSFYPLCNWAEGKTTTTWEHSNTGQGAESRAKDQSWEGNQYGIQRRGGSLPYGTSARKVASLWDRGCNMKRYNSQMGRMN